MPNALSSWLDFAEECWAEIKGSKGYRRMIYAYGLLALTDGILHQFALSTYARIHSAPILSRLSLPTWIIIFLLIAVVASIDGGRRVLARRTRQPKRPKLVGHTFDFDIEPYSEPSKEAILQSKQLNKPVLFSPEDIVGSHIYLGVDFVNDGEAETTVRKFRLEIETSDGLYQSDYAEDDEIVQRIAGQSRSDAKRF